MSPHKCMSNCLPTAQLGNPSSISSTSITRTIPASTDILGRTVLCSCQRSNLKSSSEQPRTLLLLACRTYRPGICVRRFGWNCQRTVKADLGISARIYESMGRRSTVWKMDRGRHSVE
jgi:hypothetical protein